MKKQEMSDQLSPESLRVLIDDLTDKDQKRRQYAHDALIARAESAVGPLVKALSDQRPNIRLQADKLLDEIPIDWTRHADKETVDALIVDLASKDGVVRVRARESLVSIGGKAVAPLSETLKSRDQGQRWEAAKALSQIGDPAAIGVLVNALEDQVFEIRWLAAEGLIKIGRPAVPPLLKLLIQHSDSVWSREGTHHVLHDLHDQVLKRKLRAVLNTLEDPDKYIGIPLAASAALKALK
jgi:HEAT repeat protein